MNGYPVDLRASYCEQRPDGAIARRLGDRRAGGRFCRGLAPRGLGICGHQQTRYTGQENGPQRWCWCRDGPNMRHLGPRRHVYPPPAG